MSDTPTPRAKREIVATAPSEPWTDIDRWFDQVQREFVPVFGPTYRWPNLRVPTLSAATDIEDTGGAFEVRSDLPGFSKENIDVRVQGRVLHLKAEKSEETQESKAHNYLRQERTYQSFERAFELPEPVDPEHVKAAYEDGVLTVTIPKAHPVSERKIQVA